MLRFDLLNMVAVVRFLIVVLPVVADASATRAAEVAYRGTNGDVLSVDLAQVEVGQGRDIEIGEDEYLIVFFDDNATLEFGGRSLARLKTLRSARGARLERGAFLVSVPFGKTAQVRAGGTTVQITSGTAEILVGETVVAALKYGGPLRLQTQLGSETVDSARYASKAAADGSGVPTEAQLNSEQAAARLAQIKRGGRQYPISRLLGTSTGAADADGSDAAVRRQRLDVGAVGELILAPDGTLSTQKTATAADWIQSPKELVQQTANSSGPQAPPLLPGTDTQPTPLSGTDGQFALVQQRNATFRGGKNAKTGFFQRANQNSNAQPLSFCRNEGSGPVTGDCPSGGEFIELSKETFPYVTFQGQAYPAFELPAGNPDELYLLNVVQVGLVLGVSDMLVFKKAEAARFDGMSGVFAGLGLRFPSADPDEAPTAYARIGATAFAISTDAKGYFLQTSLAAPAFDVSQLEGYVSGTDLSGMALQSDDASVALTSAQVLDEPITQLNGVTPRYSYLDWGVISGRLPAGGGVVAPMPIGYVAGREVDLGQITSFSGTAVYQGHAFGTAATDGESRNVMGSFATTWDFGRSEMDVALDFDGRLHAASGVKPTLGAGFTAGFTDGTRAISLDGRFFGPVTNGSPNAIGGGFAIQDPSAASQYEARGIFAAEKPGGS